MQIYPITKIVAVNSAFVWRKLYTTFCREKGLEKIDSRYQYNRYRGYRHYFVFKVSSFHG